MKDWKRALTELLYPGRCPVCHEIVDPRGALVCDRCRKKLHRIQEPRCKKCGKEIPDAGQEYCTDCRSTEHSYTRGTAAYPYDEIMRKSIAQFKYHNKREYARFYGESMSEALKPYLKEWDPQVCIPVPIHRKKRKKRGYNQAQLLAEEVGRVCKIPVCSGLAERIRETAPQKELDRRNRKNNLKNAFKIKEYDVKLDRVLLVDDIYTTGSTIDAISEILRERGVGRVYFIVLCTGRG